MTGGVVGSAVELFVHGLQDLWVVVSEQERTVTAEVVDVLVAIDVPLARALGTIT